MNTIYHEGQLSVSTNITLSVQVSKKELEKDLTEYTFHLDWDAQQADQNGASVKLLWELPCLDVQYMWHPESRARRVLDSDWRLKMESMLTGSAPLGVTFNGAGESIYTYASSEVRKVTGLHMGVYDLKNTLNVELTMGLNQFHGQKPATCITVRADHRRIPFHQAITDACSWWNKILGIKPMPSPESCFAPMYSSWYNFHQAITADIVEKECAMAKQLGMDSIILDDGWHSDHDGPGYGYTGDWEVCAAKFPDMRAHVKRVHDIGMKYVIWFSVPFIGYHAKCWDRFKDKILYKVERNSCAVMDPRYPEVREYLISTYERFIRDYDVDGLKLDFIDQFNDREHVPLSPDMDYACVQDATERLMIDVMNRVRAIKPDVMIEFRQRYIGPGIRQFGNMFRVGDCASDIVSNRVGVTDIRLMGEGQAAHSDMLSWNDNETPEHAALQILNVIFGVVQFSQIIANMPESHLQMTKFWLDFAARYRKTLLQSEFIPMEPQFLYPVIKAQDDYTSITAVYAINKVVDLDKSRRSIKLINATHEQILYLHWQESCNARITVTDTCGNKVREEQVCWQSGVTACSVPLSGLLEIEID